MSKAYLYVFSPKSVDQQEVTEFLDTVDGVEDWLVSMPNSVFIIGTVTARRLSKLLRDKFGDHRHFVTLIPRSGRAGWLPKDHWPRFPQEGEQGGTR